MRLRRKIDPWIDCVFKALFAEQESSDLLIDLLNGVLNPDIVVASVELLSPVNPQEFLGDDYIVVDVKARDQLGRTFQVEMQAIARSQLAGRILYTWADLFQHQLKRGRDFDELNPVISIWLLGEAMFDELPTWHHTFSLTDLGTGVRLTDHLRIDVIELPKWQRTGGALAGAERWVYFLNHAKDWDELPEDLTDPVMRRAMAVLERFSEMEADYLRYQDRMNAIREREAWRKEREMWREGLEAARQEQAMWRERREADRQELEDRREADRQELEDRLETAHRQLQARLEAERRQLEDRLEAERRQLEDRREADRQELEDRLEADRQELEAERQELEAERDRLAAKLKALGIDPDAL